MTRRYGPTGILPLATIAVAAVLLAGCGGGGTSSNDMGTTASGDGIISGSAVKGPVAGATVKAFALNGGMMAAQLSSATTDVSGAFTMPMGSYAGPVMLQMSGGTYTDEATGAVMAMGTGDMMTAVLPAIAAGANVSGVAVTPLTAMAQAMAQRMTGGMTDANIAAANAAVGNYFRVGDILHTQPMNPLVTGSGTGASQAMMNYGMTLAAMSQYAKTVGMPSSSGIVTAMMNDAADGVMDGRAGGSQVSMGGGMMGGSMMPPDAGRSGLATAMTEFMNSSLNQSGVPASTMMSLVRQMRDGTGQLR